MEMRGLQSPADGVVHRQTRECLRLLIGTSPTPPAAILTRRAVRLDITDHGLDLLKELLP
jgi:hypothetical protein